MITKREIEAIKLSPTKKDYYQIWNELLDTANKISERWSPVTTNESDPGVVLLKVLTAVADKLNYNIDKNTLEAFMPSAAQLESMHKLCELMGYDMKYYRSSQTSVFVKLKDPNSIPENTSLNLSFPFGMVFTSKDGDITYTVISEDQTMQSATSGLEIDVMEGELVECETDTGRVTIDHLDDNKRYYLPEVLVAENGIFIKNFSSDGLASQEFWTCVSNLNTQALGQKIFKFGYDSIKKSPYIQFPEDAGFLIKDGISIKYLRTRGINGNISKNVLTTFEVPANWKNTNENETSFTAEDFTVTNNMAATTGANAETIRQAYRNYKRTIGTFDTLVTCRDYINKIYGLIREDTGKNIVSNINVTDIRDDINRSQTICSFGDFGINYVTESTQKDGNKLINNFDLILYPFTNLSGYGTKKEYLNSFNYNGAIVPEIREALDIAEYKTLSHNITQPENEDDILCIKNYLRLNAKITTTYKINAAEELLIMTAIKSAIYERFNMRELDFGEEIPFDDILDCIQTADTRIKNVSLEEPKLYTKIEALDGDQKIKEYLISDIENSTASGSTTTEDINTAKKLYNKLVRRNVLAGRVSVFDYNNDFTTDYSEKEVTIYKSFDEHNILTIKKEDNTDKTVETPANYCIDTIQGRFELPLFITEKGYTNILLANATVNGNSVSPTGYTLKENELIQFRAPNRKTVNTYAGYINYYLHLDSTSEEITANTDYQLKDHEYLLFIYTPASGNSEILECYSKGTIIAPNFDLADTDTYYNPETESYDKSPTKKIEQAVIQTLLERAGVDATIKNAIMNNALIDSTLPVYSLSGEYSIEIKDLISIDLRKTLYKNNDGLCTAYFASNNATALQTALKVTPNDPYTHTLLDNEYLFYSDLDLNSLAYCGTGTDVCMSKSKWKELINNTCDANNKVSISGIIENGIQDIPFISLSLTENDSVTLKEYQYISLTTGDTIKQISGITDSDKLSADWLVIGGAEYQFNTEGTPATLPALNITDCSWTVSSRLSFNCGPSTEQKLNKYDSIELAWKYDNNGTVTNCNPIIITGGEENKYFKTNYPCQTSTNKLYVDNMFTTEYLSEDNETQIKVEKNDFAVKEFKKSNLVLPKDGNPEFPKHNYAKVFTKVSTSDFVDKDNKDTGVQPIYLNTFIPNKDCFGLISFYVTAANSSSTSDTALFTIKGMQHNVNDIDIDKPHNRIPYKTSAFNFYECTDSVLIHSPNTGENKKGPGETVIKSSSSDMIANASSINIETDASNVDYYFATNNVKNKIAILRNGLDTDSSSYLYNSCQLSADTKLYLIRIPYGCVQIEIKPTSDNKATLIFSDMSIINQKKITDTTKNYTGINNARLGYFAIPNTASDTITSEEQLLKDIIDDTKNTPFLWNCPVELSRAIDFNDNLTEENEIERLSNPKYYYDYNNINNNFVISEIDVDYINKGIVIAKSSKL